MINAMGMSKGFIVGKDKVHVSLLLFADDTLIFCKNDEAMMEILQKTSVYLNGVQDKKSIGKNLPFVELI